MLPGDDELWYLPLGGTGEIGMNMGLYGHAGQWLMVDCGVTFRRAGEPGPHLQMADPSFISARRDRLAGLLITHAHQDHIGAISYLWPQLRCPIYATRFALELIRPKLAEVGLLDRVPLHEVSAGQRTALAGFNVEWVNVTHSTVQCQALVLRTDAGSVLHSGDWKLDDQPVVGARYDVDALIRAGDEGLDAMVCDSTNANVSSNSVSEAVLEAGLLAAVQGASGRVIVGCFGSNVARLVTLARVAQKTGRYAGVMGRSLEMYYSAAKAAGEWPSDLKLVDAQHLGYLPRAEVLAIATGSQGEPRAALDRLAADSHPAFSIDPGDRLVMSARVIPGNEDAVLGVVARLTELGVEVVRDGDTDAPIHASGHATVPDLERLYGWVRPRVVIPQHGEPEHLKAHGALARRLGVSRQLVGRNGDLFILKPQTVLRRAAVQVGRLGIEREQVVRVE
ncbi:MAG: ribonuclease J [Pseudomonadota bacterium]